MAWTTPTIKSVNIKRGRNMKRNELKELGLEDEVIDKIMALHGKAVETHKGNSDKLTSKSKTMKLK